ncbi:MAG: hypothetical protein SOV20_08690, partial [Coriobacteriales bacterium]|nr:hypothetical protein [Coriobacteriales bacterium]
MAQKEAQQRGHERHDRRAKGPGIVEQMPLAAPQRDARAAGQPPQHPADKAEHMRERQHVQHAVVLAERQQRRAVVRACHQAGIRQRNRLCTRRRPAREEQDAAESGPLDALVIAA